MINEALIQAIENKQIKTIIFDLDGTLYNKKGLTKRIILSQLVWLPILSSEQKCRKAMKGASFGSAQEFYNAFFQNIAKRCFMPQRLVQWWYFRCYMPAMTRIMLHYQPQSWVREVVSECRKRDITLAVYSDYECVNEKLINLQLTPSLFDYTASAPEMGGLKPSKTCAQQVMEHLSATPESTLFVGDRDDTDAESARAVGAHFFIL